LSVKVNVTQFKHRTQTSGAELGDIVEMFVFKTNHVPDDTSAGLRPTRAHDSSSKPIDLCNGEKRDKAVREEDVEPTHTEIEAPKQTADKIVNDSKIVKLEQQ
jgi:hypothetical protein